MVKIISSKGSINILSLDAKDIWISNNYPGPSPIGYNIRNQNGVIHTKKFINTLDYSLDAIKLREIYERVYRRTNFSFSQNKKEYTQSVINVTFKYSIKEFNRVCNKTFIKNGYSIDDVELKDCICIKNAELIAIKVNEEVQTPASNDLLGDHFYYESGVYKAKQNIKTVLGVADLRKSLYQDGFYCDGIKYIRFKRSSGSSRVGKCLFIDEKLYSRMHKWEMCGLKTNENQEIDLAALEAYIALPISSIIGTIEISPDNILVIDDYESHFKDTVIAVDCKVDKLEANEVTTEIANSIFDGQSLISPDIMGDYSDKGFILLRNRFFKSACFNCNIQKWFCDNGITDIERLQGFTLAKSIEQIKLITTPNSIKYLKFGKLEDWLYKLEPTFGVVKHEKKTHFFDGRLVQLHYQLLNTLQMSQSDVDELLAPSLDYLRLIKTEPAVLRYYIKYPEDCNFDNSPAKCKNEIVYKMLGINEDFSKTKLYHDFRNELTKAYIKNLRCGHILVNGNYSTLLGNPIEMLQMAIGTFQGISQIGVGNICSSRFSYGVELLGSRSPHVTAGNILVARNTKNAQIEKYLNLSDEIVCVNSIGENLLNRLSGSDFDSDTILLTDNQLLIKIALKHYQEFFVPTSLVSGRKIKRKYDANQKACLDIKTSVNKIGEIVNLSQELNTLMWDKLNTGQSFNDVKNLYFDISKLDVLSMIEIDKAKKEYIVDSALEIESIRKKYNLVDPKGRKIKPNFFSHIAKAKGYYDPIKKKYQFHETTMDYIQHTINKFRLPNERSKFIPFSDLLKPKDFSITRPRYASINRVIDLIRDTKKQISYIWQSESEGYSHEEKRKITAGLRQECIDYIDKLSIGRNTMYWLLNSIEAADCKDISGMIFTTLFGAPNKSFYSFIQESASPIEKIEESPAGELEIHGLRYSKFTKKADLVGREEKV